MLKPYREYKEVHGLHGFSQIPEHWNISRIGKRFDIKLGKMLQPQQKNTNDLYAEYLCAANIKWNGVDTSKIKQMWFSPAEIDLYKLCENDLLVTEGGTVGVSAIWHNELTECYIQNSVHRVRSREDNIKYLHYWLFYLSETGYIKSICNKATIAHYTKEKLSASPFLIPPRPEQDQIVRFLDWKVSLIYKYINAKQKQIALLQEQKQAIINQAVTKGGSGWTFSSFKRFTISANTGVSITKEYWESEGRTVLYTAGQKPLKTNYNNFPEEWLTNKNDILVARNGAGSVHLPQVNSVYTDHVIRFNLNNMIHRKYVYYALLIGMEKIVREANAVSLKTLNKSDWDNLILSIPPRPEQEEIVRFLDEKTSLIDECVDKISGELDLLSEYRARLISDVVSGRVDVRNAAVPDLGVEDAPESGKGENDDAEQ